MPRLTAPALVQGVSALGGCGAVALWWDDTRPFTRSLGNELTNAGRILGLVGGYLVALMLLLMARIPMLDRRIGAQQLARWHATVGRCVVLALTAHAVLITWGYAASADRALVSQTGRLWERYPDVLMATVALGLLIGVGILSARAVRRRLAYETWYHLHLYTYLAIGLAFAHSFANGADFSRSLRNRVLWSGLYGVAVAAVVVFRLVLPALRALRQGAVVERVVTEAPGVVSLHLRGRGWRADPGQFVRLRVLDRTGWWQSHPFSVSRCGGGALRVTAKAVGDHTSSLAQVRPGTRVLVEGPYGSLTPDRRSQRKVLLVAGGIGITPLLPLLAALPADPGELTLLWRASSAEDLALRSEVTEAARSVGARVFFLLGDRDSSPLDDRRLRALVPAIDEHDVFVCGPDGLVKQVSGALRRLGVPRHHIHAEQFALS